MQPRDVGVEVYRPCSLGIAFPRKRAGRTQSQCALAAKLVYIKKNKTRLDSTLPYTVMSAGAATAHYHNRFSKSFGQLWTMRLRINLLRLLRPPPWSAKHKINDPQNGPRRQHSIPDAAPNNLIVLGRSGQMQAPHLPL